MLTKQQAIKLSKALNVGNNEVQNIFANIGNRKISASKAKSLSARVKELEVMASNATSIIANSFNNVSEVIKASKIGVIEKLSTQAAGLSLQAQILKKLIAEADELSELEDEVEAEEGCDNLDAEDEIDEVEGEDDELDAEDETIDELDADEDELDTEDEIDEVVEARRSSRTKAARKKSVKASSVKAANSTLINWNFGKAGR